VATVAQTIADLAARSVPVEDAVAAGTWPFPDEALGNAVRRGYQLLPRQPKQLPLV